MRVLLYSENLEGIKKSGLGKAIHHQIKALEYAQIDFTTDPHESFDLLHINTYFPKSYYLAQKTRSQGKTVVYHAHSTEEDFYNSFRFSNQLAPLFKKWLIRSYSLGDIVITPTAYSQGLLESYGIDREIVALSNGIDMSELHLSVPDCFVKKESRRKYEYTSTDFIVMGIGLYLKRKGILDFVELAHRMPHLQFIWFGYLDLRFVPQEIRWAVESGLPNLTFAGYVSSAEIRIALQATDLYIFPTLEETEGMPALEACAMKADFIVRDIPVFEDWLVDGETVYKAKSVDDFEALIQAFYHEQLPSLTETAHQVALERDLPLIGQALKQIYKKAQQISHQRSLY